MKEFRIFFSVLAGILLIMCFAYHSRLMPVMLLTTVVVCVTSVALSIITRLSISVQVKDGPAQVRRKDQINLTVRIKNNFIIPLTPVRVYVKVCENGMYLPQNKMIIIAVAPMGEVTLNIHNIVSYRGRYTLGLERVEFFDILKICRFKILRNKPWGVISYPRDMTANTVCDDNQDESEVSRTKPHGFNKDAFSHLREYREGESLRYIHWKLSARMDDLIVKQMESNHDYSSLVFCDFTGENPAHLLRESTVEDVTMESILEASDIAIEVSTAIIRRILMSGNSVIYLWQDLRTGKCEVKEIADLQGCDELNGTLALLPAEPFSAEFGRFEDLFDEFNEEIRLERAVYIITSKITEGLVEKLRSTGLIFQKNVTIVAIAGLVTSAECENLIEYLTTQTKVKVRRIESDDEESIKAFNSFDKAGGVRGYVV
jgi:hypothetical protein